MILHLQTRARCWLFFSYMIAFGSIAGAVAVLLKTTSAGEHVQVGVVCLYQHLAYGLAIIICHECIVNNQG